MASIRWTTLLSLRVLPGHSAGGRYRRLRTRRTNVQLPKWHNVHLSGVPERWNRRGGVPATATVPMCLGARQWLSTLAATIRYTLRFGGFALRLFRLLAVRRPVSRRNLAAGLQRPVRLSASLPRQRRTVPTQLPACRSRYLLRARGTCPWNRQKGQRWPVRLNWRYPPLMTTAKSCSPTIPSRRRRSCA